jgi:glucose-6-phosphate 1-dehydrogenase
MIVRYVVLGGAGDLMQRYLAPALGELHAAGELTDDFEVVGAARDERSDDDYRALIADALDEHGSALPKDSRDAVIGMLRYVQADATDPDDLAEAVRPDDGDAVVHLALPPAVFGPAMEGLAAMGLTDGSQLVVEKPFGNGLDEARELNRIVHRCLSEDRVFRIDHFLGMQTVQNILGLRFANRILEPVWNCHHVERVEIVWDEQLTLEGRAFYDDVGALVDVLQNHLLQVLCLAAMEPPSSLDSEELRDRKTQLLREVRRMDRDEVAQRTVRARYGAGTIDGRDVPAYLDEEGVDPEKRTETFAEVELAVDNWRWAGVPFVLRTGKALGTDRKAVVVRFRDVPHRTFREGHGGPNELRIDLEPEALHLQVNVNSLGSEFATEPTVLDRELAAGEVSAYGRVILAALQGDPTLSIRDDEIEQAWEVVHPIRQAWADGMPELEEYPAGSAGPAASRLNG